MTTYADLIRISEEEMPGIGSYALDRQMRNLGILPDRLGDDEIPQIARAMSEVASMFGKNRAKSVRKKMLSLIERKNYLEGKDVEKKIEMLKDIGYSAYFSGEWNDAIENLESARALAKENAFDRVVIEIDARMSRILSRKKDFKDAMKYVSEAEKLLEKTYDRDLKAEVLYEKAAVEWWSGHTKEAMEHFRRSLELAERIKDHRLMGLANMGMANIYSETGDVENDLYHSMEALKHFEKSDSHEELAKMYTNIGVTYEELGNFMQAERYYLQCVEYSRSIGYILMEAWAFLNLSELYIKMGNLESAESYAANAFQAYEEMKDQLGVSLTLERFATIYSEMHEYEKADKYFRESIALKEKYDTPYGMALTLCTYAKIMKGKDVKEHVSRAVKIFTDIGNLAKAEECRKIISA